MSVYLRDTSKSKDAAKYPWIARCDVGTCVYSVSRQAEQDAHIALSTHPCPLRPSVRGFMVSTTLLQQAWEMLDSKMETIMSSRTIPESQTDEAVAEARRLRSEARGMAEVLALFMQPHMRTADEIAAEASRRYTAKQAGEVYETAGLGSRRLEAPPGSPIRSGPSGRGPTPSHNLSKEDIAGIKNAAGMFPPEELSKVYKVPVSVIKAILEES